MLCLFYLYRYNCYPIHNIIPVHRLQLDAPVSAAERRGQCHERLNADPGRKEKHLQKERERWRQKRERRKSIHEFSERDQRQKVHIMERATEKPRLKRKLSVSGHSITSYYSLVITKIP